MKIYTAGPMSGQTFNTIIEKYKLQTKILKLFGYEVLCPLTGKNLPEKGSFAGKGLDSPESTCHAIKKRDRWMVGQADIILADFTVTNGKVSIGTCMELAWADELGKHVIVVMKEDNPHYHSFVLECADIVFPEIGDAYKYLESLIKGFE